MPRPALGHSPYLYTWSIMDTQKYNGWTNYATWLVNMHFECLDFSDEIEDGVFDNMDKADILCYLASWIQEMVEEHVEQYDVPYGRGGFVIDLIDSTLSDVDWHDIADHYVDDIMEAVLNKDLVAA